MKTYSKKEYNPPCTEVIKVQPGGLVCQSNVDELNAVLWSESIDVIDVTTLDF